MRAEGQRLHAEKAQWKGAVKRQVAKQQGENMKTVWDAGKRKGASQQERGYGGSDWFDVRTVDKLIESTASLGFETGDFGKQGTKPNIGGGQNGKRRRGRQNSRRRGFARNPRTPRSTTKGMGSKKVLRNDGHPWGLLLLRKKNRNGEGPEKTNSSEENWGVGGGIPSWCESTPAVMKRSMPVVPKRKEVRSLELGKEKRLHKGWVRKGHRSSIVAECICSLQGRVRRS